MTLKEKEKPLTPVAEDFIVLKVNDLSTSLPAVCLEAFSGDLDCLTQLRLYRV